MERKFGYHAGYRVEHLTVGIFIICPHPCCLQSLPQEARYTIEISFQLNSPTISTFRGYYSQPTLLQPPHQILLYKIGCAKSSSLLQPSPAHTYCTAYKTSICSVLDLSAGAYKIYYTQGDTPSNHPAKYFTLAILFRMGRSGLTGRQSCFLLVGSVYRLSGDVRSMA